MSESITITNHTKQTLQFTTIQDKSIPEEQRSAKHTIAPSEHLTIFTNRVVSLHWEKSHG